MLKDVLKKLFRKEFFEVFQAGYNKRLEDEPLFSLRSKEEFIRNVLVDKPVFALQPYWANPVIGMCIGVEYIPIAGGIKSPVPIIRDFVSGTDIVVTSDVKICTSQKLRGLLDVAQKDRWALLNNHYSETLEPNYSFPEGSILTKEEIMDNLRVQGFLDILYSWEKLSAKRTNFAIKDGVAYLKS